MGALSYVLRNAVAKNVPRFSSSISDEELDRGQWERATIWGSGSFSIVMSQTSHTGRLSVVVERRGSHPSSKQIPVEFLAEQLDCGSVPEQPICDLHDKRSWFEQMLVVSVACMEQIEVRPALWDILAIKYGQHAEASENPELLEDEEKS